MQPPRGPGVPTTPGRAPFLPSPIARVPLAAARRFVPLLAVLVASPLEGQGSAGVGIAGQAIGSVTRVADVPGGETQTEARVVQPVLMLEGFVLDGRIRLLGTLNLEGQTMADGELLPGGWGEGFNDKRHPHTYVHELMLTGSDLLGALDGPVRVSLGVGKGFVPYGSDDPMSRPLFRYPVNHHLAQLLERATLQGGVRAGPVALEGALFNGDEPERPGQWPLLDRFGDSWAARLTLIPMAGIEASVSRAKVHSPEHRPGAGSDAWKWHLGLRAERPVAGGDGYALAEWARTEEAWGFFVFESLLAEAAWKRGAHQPYYRFERTDRPEDMRTLNLFRSVRPHLENAILGTTRFTLHTVGYAHERRLAGGDLALQPFVEVTLGTARSLDGGVLTPEILYGTTRVRSVAGGIRLSWRMLGHRMGRYGGLLAARPDAHAHDM